MFDLLSRLVGAAREFLTREPILALALCGAFAAVYLRTLLNGGAAPPEDSAPIWPRLWRTVARLAAAGALAAGLAGAFVGLRSYLNDTLATFRFTHGRVSEVNLDAVRTIWGDEQVQGDLSVGLSYDVEETERLEPEDPTMPAVLRKKTVTHSVDENAFVSARHAVTLRPSARRKGSAVYSGYETDDHFEWSLRNPAHRDVRARLRFPLPSTTAVYDALAVKLDGADVLDRVTMTSDALVLEEPLAADRAFRLEVSFKSRGLSYWYFQVREPREIRDLVLTLALPDLARGDLNYPEGCMPPTAVDATPDGRGSVLTYKLDRAISNKGMGVSLPAPGQPGETTSAVLGYTVTGWGLVFAALLFGLTSARVRHAPLVALFAGALVALGYGLLADFSDLLFGFWLSAVAVLVPLFAAIGVLVTRAVPGAEGRVLGAALVLFGLLYPCVAGLDPDRDVLYLNLSGLAFLSLASWQLWRRLRLPPGARSAAADAAAAGPS
ncbi:MAG TPA: hypothetical protein VG389_13390 [Myxococcota bacterium]|jgi:hypothetical protein|nr:hypothetical protein [Myxococcota bacterium]